MQCHVVNTLQWSFSKSNSLILNYPCSKILLVSLPCYLEALTYILWLLITFPSKFLPQIFRLVMLACVHNRCLDIYWIVWVHWFAMLGHSESYEHQPLFSFKPLVSKNISWQVKLDTALLYLYLILIELIYFQTHLSQNYFSNLKWTMWDLVIH